MADGSALEQWAVWLINHARLDPEAMAMRFGIDLNEGLPPGTIQLTPMQPLAISDILSATADFQGAWLLDNDAFGTTGIQGSNPGERIDAAGYPADAGWDWAELVNWRGFAAGIPPQNIDLETVMYNFMRGVFLDPELRALLLRPDYTEVGVSQVQGDYQRNGADWYASMLTIDMVGNPASRFITGQVWNVLSPELTLGSPSVGIAVVGSDESDTTGLGGGYTVRATSDAQVLSLGNAMVSLVMPDHNVQIDLVYGTIESSTTLTLLSAGGARLSGAADVGLFAADSAGNAWLEGNRGNNHLVGNSSNNQLDGRTGADTMEGGRGNDTYSVDNIGDRVIELANGGTDTVIASSSFTLEAGSSVERIQAIYRIFSDPMDLTGNELAQRIEGNYGVNRLDGGGGGDILDGGNGDDTFIVRDARDVIIETAAGGDDRVLAAVSYSLQAGSEIERLETLNHNGTEAIRLVGNAFAQTIIGNAGANSLNGQGGNDVLDGGAGADKLFGGTGNDTYIVDNLGDKVYENAGEGTDLVQSSVSYSLVGQHIERLTLTGSANLDGTGNTYANTITGNSGNNALDGGTGADKLYGGLGNDTFIIDNLGDKAYESINQGTDTVRSSVNYSLVGQYIENLVLTGSGSTTATGNGFANTITGNSGNNVIDGGGGSDTLFGGGGSDKFRFSTALGSSNVDHLVDFSSSNDDIQLDLAIFNTFTQGGGIGEAAFKNLALGAVDATDRILFDQASGDIFYDRDGSGALKAILFAHLDNGAIVTSSDFLLV